MNAADYIDDYMDGSLTGDTLLKFEEALASDEKLKHLVDNYEEVKSVAEGLLELQLLDEINAARPVTNIQPTGQHRSKYLLMAAALLMLAAIAWYFTSNSPAPIEEQPRQFAEAYKEPIWPTVRSSQTDQTDKYYQSKAANEFLSGNLPTAKVVLLDSMADQRMARYWLAEMYMAEQEFDSVLVYVPEFEDDHIKYERSVYLRELAGNMLELK